jgi:protein transport protein SEC31
LENGAHALRIIISDVTYLFMSSDLERWQETLAVLSTYGKTEEFAQLCGVLGRRWVLFATE